MAVMMGRGLRALAIAGMLLTTAFLPPRQETHNIHITQIDTSEFPRITVYVSVTDGSGEPLAIDPTQMALSENGKAVQPEEVHPLGEADPLSTLLVMDVSGSMNKADKLAGAKTAAATYVRQMQAGDRTGLLTFNTQVDLVQPLTTDHQALLTAIDGIVAQHDTAMYDALYQGVEILSNVSGRKAILVLTDGLDNRSQHTSSDVISRIGPSGLSISTIGLGDPSLAGVNQAGLDVGALRSLAGRAGGTYAYAADQSALTTIYARYSRALHSEYAFTYTTGALLRDGVNRSLKVSLSSAASSSEVTATYNPGGLVPEVRQPNSWLLFFGLLAGLVLLLIAPGVLGRLFGAHQGRPIPAQRIKLADTPKRRVRLR
jgi:VWFA-related protein